MRTVVQRVLTASVTVDGKIVGEIEGPGLVVLLGVTHDDGPEQVAWMARKIWSLRILRDEQAASDVDAPVLVVSTASGTSSSTSPSRPTQIGPVSKPP